MRSAKVLYKKKEAGVLVQQDDGTFVFHYHPQWVEDASKPPISLTLPKTNEPYHSRHLFPFFYHMLPEGTNKQVICHRFRMDEDDHMGILMAVAKTDTIGAVRVLSTEMQ